MLVEASVDICKVTYEMHVIRPMQYVCLPVWEIFLGLGPGYRPTYPNGNIFSLPHGGDHGSPGSKCCVI